MRRPLEIQGKAEEPVSAPVPVTQQVIVKPANDHVWLIVSLGLLAAASVGVVLWVTGIITIPGLTVGTTGTQTGTAISTGTGTGTQ